MTSSTTPFWTTVLRAARIGSPSPVSKKNAKKAASSNSSPAETVKTAAASAFNNPSAVAEPAPVLVKSFPVQIPSPIKKATVDDVFKPSAGDDSSSSIVRHEKKFQSMPESEWRQPCVHPAVSKVLAFEMEGDLSSLKRANSSHDTVGSSSLSSLTSRRSSLCTTSGSRRESIASLSTRRRVSFAQSPALVVQYDVQQPATKCLDKKVSECLEPEAEEEAIDLSTASAIAPAADDEWLQNQQQEEEDAKTAARIRAKQVKQLEQARALAQQQQAQRQQQQQRSRRTSWANALSASTLSLGSGIGGVVL